MSQALYINDFPYGDGTFLSLSCHAIKGTFAMWLKCQLILDLIDLSVTRTPPLAASLAPGSSSLVPFDRTGLCKLGGRLNFSLLNDRICPSYLPVAWFNV